MLKIDNFLGSDGRFLQAWASGSHREKRFTVNSLVFPPLKKQQVLIDHNKFVVLIEQLTFSGNSTGWLTGCTRY